MWRLLRALCMAPGGAGTPPVHSRAYAWGAFISIANSARWRGLARSNKEAKALLRFVRGPNDEFHCAWRTQWVRYILPSRFFHLTPGSDQSRGRGDSSSETLPRYVTSREFTTLRDSSSTSRTSASRTSSTSRSSSSSRTSRTMDQTSTCTYPDTRPCAEALTRQPPRLRTGRPRATGTYAPGMSDCRLDPRAYTWSSSSRASTRDRSSSTSRDSPTSSSTDSRTSSSPTSSSSRDGGGENLSLIHI